ncbi:MAG: bifunctional (p)ppGpp synthetase/guanosine-3',5'-bis(diphosphate) 3'-pyrophosphohydrolase [Solirubrobacterales bacterium]|nr:bifunctional (p)ppGpp synthetase/guanosine-3',5'-bis(diphosphate) 3'-pyrophosphohydrolase [Solirubrobacterales bacterium]
MMEAPDFAAGRELVEAAYEHAYRAHCGPASEGDTEIDHPVAVAQLLDRAGFGDEVIAAALLHDVVEDTSEGLDLISRGFGDEVCNLVKAMTEDDSIEPYEARKAEHRERVLAAGAAPASIYAADKLARVRSYVASGEAVDDQRLDHYWDTLQLFAGRRPELPFLSELAAELPQLEPDDEDPAAEAGDETPAT